MLNKFFGGGTIKKFVRSLLTTDKTVSQAGEFAADARSIYDLDQRFNYSQSERVIGKWINNKPLYEILLKVKLGSITQDTWTKIATLDSNLNINFNNPVKIDIFAYDPYGTQDGWITPAMFSTTAPSSTVPCLPRCITMKVKNNRDIMFLSSVNIASTNDNYIYFTVQYTKTTD